MGLTRPATWYVIDQITDARSRLSGTMLVNFKSQLSRQHRQSLANEDVAECLDILKQSVKAKHIDLDDYTSATSSYFSEHALLKMVQSQNIPLTRIQISALFSAYAVDGKLHKEKLRFLNIQAPVRAATSKIS